MATRYPLRQQMNTYAVALSYGKSMLGPMTRQMMDIGPKKFFYMKKRDKPPPCLEDPSLGTHHFVQLKNVKLHYVANGEEGKPLMLFLHGFPEFWYSWRHQLREFGKDYRAVAIDMRGYGDSDKPSAVHDYTADKLATDVKELVHALGYNNCILVAHDWGGSVAFRVAMQYPEIVNRLICCNMTHPVAFFQHLMTSKSQQRKSWYVNFFQLSPMAEIFMQCNDMASIDGMFGSDPEKKSLWHKSVGAKPGTCTAEDVEAFKYAFSKPGGMVCPINYYRAMMRYQLPMYKVKVLPMPTQIIWGTADRALEKEMAEKAGKYITDFTLDFIEGASHWVQQEEPERVNMLMRKFLLKHQQSAL